MEYVIAIAAIAVLAYFILRKRRPRGTPTSGGGSGGKKPPTQAEK